VLHNLSAEPMPVSIGFHPAFQVNDAPRDEWTFAVGAKTNWVLTGEKIPTGETRPIERLLPNPRGARLKDVGLDDVFTDLIRDASGKAVMWLQGKSQKVEVAIGPNYKAVVVYIYPHGPSDSSGACPDVLSALLIGRPAGNHERSLCPAHARAEVCSAALAGLLPEPAPAEE